MGCRAGARVDRIVQSSREIARRVPAPLSPGGTPGRLRTNQSPRKGSAAQDHCRMGCRAGSSIGSSNRVAKLPGGARAPQPRRNARSTRTNQSPRKGSAAQDHCRVGCRVGCRAGRRADRPIESRNCPAGPRPSAPAERPVDQNQSEPAEGKRRSRSLSSGLSSGLSGGASSGSSNRVAKLPGEAAPLSPGGSPVDQNQSEPAEGKRRSRSLSSGLSSGLSGGASSGSSNRVAKLPGEAAPLSPGGSPVDQNQSEPAEGKRRSRSLSSGLSGGASSGLSSGASNRVAKLPGEASPLSPGGTPGQPEPIRARGGEAPLKIIVEWVVERSV